MRKSDKIKNFKKINLIVENRYLESKGIIKESIFGNMFGGSKNSSDSPAMSEVDNYNFERLFTQIGGGQYSEPKFAIGRISDAKKEMPKVAELLPDLFKLSDKGLYVQCYIMINGERINGVIPSSFEYLLGDNSILSDDVAKGKIKQMISQGGIREY